MSAWYLIGIIGIKPPPEPIANFWGNIRQIAPVIMKYGDIG